MLTLVEKVLFIILVITSFVLAYKTFTRMFKIIARGTEPIPWKETLKTIVVEGEVRPMVEKKILPSVANPGDQFWLALLMLVAGVILILSVEIGLTRNKKHS